MELSRIMELAEALAEESDQVELYPQYGRLVILRNIGKIIGACDRQYVDFLCLSNGMRAFDHEFYGFKSQELRPYLHDHMLSLWAWDSMLAGSFWGFASSSSGLRWGYLAKVDSAGNHYIGAYDRARRREVFLIASSFNVFMWKFLSGLQAALRKGVEPPRGSARRGRAMSMTRSSLPRRRRLRDSATAHEQPLGAPLPCGEGCVWTRPLCICAIMCIFVRISYARYTDEARHRDRGDTLRG